MVSQVASSKDLTKFEMFVRVCLAFFPLSKFFFFLFHPLIFIQLNIESYFFSLLSMKKYFGFENDPVI
jgi:hypothetical protein